MTTGIMPQFVIQLNFEQNIETSSKILSIIGKEKESPEIKIGENKSKIILRIIGL